MRMSRRAPDEAYELAAESIPLGGASRAYHLSQITKAVDAAAPSIRSQERQRVRESLEGMVKRQELNSEDCGWVVPTPSIEAALDSLEDGDE